MQQTSPQVQNGRENDYSQMTSDPIMAGIFADTARTTMLEQVAAERNGPVTSPPPNMGDRASRQAASSDPMSLFGESANNWAALAFSDPKNSK